eukprot:scaffold1085_cov407-Prasinococcus_capsulatus_cf.AAC.49
MSPLTCEEWLTHIVRTVTSDMSSTLPSTSCVPKLSTERCKSSSRHPELEYTPRVSTSLLSLGQTKHTGMEKSAAAKAPPDTAPKVHTPMKLFHAIAKPPVARASALNLLGGMYMLKVPPVRVSCTLEPAGFLRSVPPRVRRCKPQLPCLNTVPGLLFLKRVAGAEVMSNTSSLPN